MIYVVFTGEGLARALEEADAADGLALNPGLVDGAELAGLAARFASAEALPAPVNPRREAEIVAAVEAVERRHPHAELMVEYP